MSLTFSQIMIILTVIACLILAVRLMQPKFTFTEKYLLYLIQRKSPQIDNIRLFMWTKMVIHPINDLNDLDFQKIYLDDPQQFKMLTEQANGFGAYALYPLLGYEAVNWNLDEKVENPLILRLSAVLTCQRYPHTAEVIEGFLIHAPDSSSSVYFNKHSGSFAPSSNFRGRYAFNLYQILRIITCTSRNEWWPGTSPDIREWAESVLVRLAKAFADCDPSIFEPSYPDQKPQK